MRKRRRIQVLAVLSSFAMLAAVPLWVPLLMDVAVGVGDWLGDLVQSFIGSSEISGELGIRWL